MRNGLVFLAILLLVGGAIWYDLNPRYPIREGLDLKGGMRVILEADRAEIARRKLNVTIDDETMERVRGIMENRVNGFGLSGATVQTKGRDQIVVMLPGARNPEQALAQLRKTAQLEFRWLKEVQTQKAPGRRYTMDVQEGEGQAADRYTFRDTSVSKPATLQEVLEKSDLILTGSDLLPKSGQSVNPMGGRAEPVVNFEFNSRGGPIFANFTTQNVGEYLAIVLDNEIISAPVIEEPITEGKGVIRGAFGTIAEARNLAALLNSGSLPIPVKVAEMQTVGATLGLEAIRKSIAAGLAGLAFVLLFMLLYYRLPGLLADIALVFYAALSFATFKLGNVVLDLPGITGFILSVGMAVDANILIFDRVREELRAGKTVHAAIDAGFNRAFSSIFDSNVSTWITCAILFWLGAPVIKGFALTLAIGVAVSMFTAITVTRTMLHLVVGMPWARSNWMFGLNVSWLSTRFGDGRWLRIWEGRRVYLSVSAALMLVAIGCLATGGLKPGIDFTGGSQVQVVFNQQPDMNRLRALLGENGIRDAQVTQGSANFVKTTVTVPITGDMAVTAREDLRARLAEIRGFDESAYKEVADTAKKTTTVTAVFYTAQDPVSKEAVTQALTARVLVGSQTARRELARPPSTFTVNPQVEPKPNLPVIVITSRQLTDARAPAINQGLAQLGGGYIQPAYQRQTIGPSIAAEVTWNAFWSMLLASIMIIGYLAFRFAIGGLVNGLKFGVCAVLALIHDVLFTTGFFALMGLIAGWQVDSLYVTAVLMIIGFSVHDTIVVYDRIRENLRNRLRGETFEQVTNRSITQTFDRSLNTSLTVLLVLAALFLYGGESIKLFNVALFLGIAVGAYSSIFVASPLVVLWEKWSNRAAATAKADVQLRGGPSGRPARPTAPPPARPRPTASAEGNGAVEREEVGAGAGAGGPKARPAGGGGSTIKPKRKRRS